ncbi:proline--tRNA ligase [Paenibacillus alkalitolerans]|uniref:proline--tRNA ligase n=1 Tax=Paenibacillus alkalitolerans TaxID=2799335 RepID=UPI0018F39D84|nr:proline--tRNA ligase [Paenibacillus alkalitolerans]
MRQNKMLIPTLREAPSEAEAASHQLLLRAGFIRQTAAGVYAYLPLGWRVLNRVANIVREELDHIDALEILMPAMQPAELWHQSGRYQVYGEELIRFKDRHDREFALGPTHEEVITSLVGNEVSSYRKLPLVLYQIQTKFRDERRPRFGLLRGREFLMKDAYSFHADWESLDHSYWRMYEAYTKIFTRCGLNFRAVQADPGAIGGEGGTHEFMALADIGEDTVVTCTDCDYAANLEKAEAGYRNSSETFADIEAPYEMFSTPNIKTINELVGFTGVDAKHIVKTLIYMSDGNPVAVLVRGDREVNEIKLKNALGAEQLELADTATTEQVIGAPVGFAGPVGLSVPILADKEVTAIGAVIAGANKKDHHLKNVVPGRDFQADAAHDIRNAAQGDPCPQCSGTLQFHRGIEIGHVFKLGTKYSGKLGAAVLDDSGHNRSMIMGCYGIGISRILSAIVEQNRDPDGIVWTASIAPFHVHMIVVAVADNGQMQLAEDMYVRLKQRGVEVLLDDREERPGVKFKDADLIGIPVRITIGKRAGEGMVEYKERRSGEQTVISVEEAVSRVCGYVL